MERKEKVAAGADTLGVIWSKWAETKQHVSDPLGGVVVGMARELGNLRIQEVSLNLRSSKILLSNPPKGQVRTWSIFCCCCCFLRVPLLFRPVFRTPTSSPSQCHYILECILLLLFLFRVQVVVVKFAIPILEHPKVVVVAVN